MKKLMRLLAMTLAAAMLLSVGALAAENGNSGPKLVWNWLDWDEGHFVNDDALSGRNYGDEEMHITPGDEYSVIFFTIGEDGRRTPVIPKAGKGVAIEKLNADEIASGAKQSQYYVRVRVDSWGESEITSGKASMKVAAELPDVGFYTSPEAAQSSYLRNDQQPFDPSRLTDKAVYLVRNETDPNQRVITDVKKNSNGNSSMYDLEKVSGDVWKITLKLEDEGGVGVSLDVSFRESDGNAYTEERGCGFEYPRGPELWLSWLDWNEEEGLFLPEDAEVYGGMQPHPTDEHTNLIFYTCDYDEKGEQTFKPVLPKDLKGSDGVTITDVSDESTASMAQYFVNVKVDGWEKKYTITSGEYTMKFDSYLPDFGIYSKPELTPDAYLTEWRFSPTVPNETVYLGSYFQEGDGRTLEDIKFASGFDGISREFTLERYNDSFFKLTRKSLLMSSGDLPLEVTWKWSDGHTETADAPIYTQTVLSVVASESPLPDPLKEDAVLYDDIADKLSATIPLKAGEAKTIYLGLTYFRFEPLGWNFVPAIPVEYCTTDGLKLTPDLSGGDPLKYTISCNTPGDYEISLTDYFEWLVYDRDGNEVSDELSAQGVHPQYDFDTGEWSLITADSDGNAVPYEFDGTIKANPGTTPSGDIYSLKVTVTGEASKPAESGKASFPDVAGSWYAPAVDFASSNGYMTGNADGTFNPNGQIKGSEFAQILYNKEGKPAAADGASFNGVSAQWYAPAILWAAGKGIVTDSGDAAVDPTKDLTRQQIALMLYNYMGKPAAGADMSAFADADQISDWALDAVKWAVSEGILKGSAEGGSMKLNPTGTARRSETAQILMNLFG